ncbi:MAG: lipoprotein-releasing ABC transporter permease subunit [Betaproteobacteria bacterium]|jgi:lipoprotein-releasing system permease protein|nr:lipoprotein-releasing ABC transporter permease subunit [Betaproteobacteria bacterium]NBT69143.1 lipoprotein-releasing ABC transporter permease subunit [Betaproteobacteria bacterium]NBY08668.1 lipoprotein-releasing ABC transporter permease subunit [Betaproteobacteria bacterium]
MQNKSFWLYELLIGWRFTRAGKVARRNRFISFISSVSMFGIALGVAALIIVLSVMNGFQKEVRDRMLGVLSHIEVLAYSGESLANATQISQAIAATPQVVSQAPFVMSQVLVARGEDMRGAMVRGIDPVQESAVTDIVAAWSDALKEKLQPGLFNVVLGGELARALGVRAGDRITLISPGGQMTPAGVVPRLKQLEVIGTVDSGHFEYDATLAFIHIEDAQRIFRLDGPAGIRIKINDAQQARQVANQLVSALGSDVIVRDWTRQNRNWFAAVEIEKRMMFIILTLIVAVAAFNLVSTLVMTVTDKRADIAILRTLGASPASIMSIFVVQGATVGFIGTVGGLLMGLLVSFNIDVIVPAIEKLLGASFLPRDIYLISRMPSDPQAADIWPIVLIAFLLSLLATLYPSWRASRIDPAEALRYE